MESIQIKGIARTDLGKKSAKADRKAGNVPCVIYGSGDNIHFSADTKAFKDLIYTPNFHTAAISVDGQAYKCIIKAIQFHPVTDAIEHIDFLQLIDGNNIKVEVPIRFRGIAPGTKAGGKLTQKLRKVKVKTKPEFLKDELFVDVSTLELGQSVKVRDIELADGMELETSPGIPVASVEVPRALRSAKSTADKADGADEAESTEE